ncbi:MAG: extracellular solute-binding protein [Planctomycetota bacterium]|nr:extracellular solute-binding protein [Planctomycetota bacterium]
MRKVLPVLFAVFLAILAIVPFLMRPDRRAGDVALVILSPHWDGIKEEFGRAFERRYCEKTGRRVRVEWLDVGGGTGDMKRYIESQFAASRGRTSGVDVFFGGGADTHMELASAGYLEPVDLPEEILSRIASETNGIPVYDARDGKWYGACLSGFGILYNKVVLARLGVPEPRTWADLADPRLRTWIGCGDPTSSGAIHVCFEIILQGYGFEKGFGILTRIAGNVRAFNEGGSAVTRDVNMGQVACGMVIDFLALPPLRTRGGEHLGFVIPKGLSVYSADPIAVLKGAPHYETAVAFLEFVMGEEGQRLWYQKRGTPGGPERFDLERFPVMPDLYDRGLPTNLSGKPPFGPADPAVLRYDPVLSGKRWRLLNDLLRATILDSHRELQEAWTAVAAAGVPDDLAGELGKPPVNERELSRLAAGRPAPDLRARLRAEWTAASKAKYAGVRMEAERRSRK